MGTRPNEYLSHYAKVFDAVELDTTFYGIPQPGNVELWRHASPSGFQFTAKVPRSITHDQRLLASHGEFLDFLKTMAPLKDKLGPVLIQLPPDFTIDERAPLEAFLGNLCDGFDYAVEFRHQSWMGDRILELLRSRRVAWTMTDLKYMPPAVEVTADFTYVRLLGDRRAIRRMHGTQIDRQAELDEWARRLEEVSGQVERAYLFVNNHYSGHSPADVRYLAKRLKLPERETAPQQKALL